MNYAHDEEGARRVVEAITDAGRRAIAARFDATEPAAAKAGIERIAALLGPAELIVNNATGPQPVMPIAQQNWDVHLGQLHFFVKAPLLLL